MFESKLKVSGIIEKYALENKEQLEKLNINKDKLRDIKKDALYLIEEDFEYNTIHIDEDYVQSINGKIYQTKKRWKDKELKNKSTLTEKVNKSKLFYETIPNADKKFNEFYGVPNPNAFENLLRSQIIKWFNNKDNSLISFPYIEYKLNYQVERAIQNDIQKLIALDVIAEKRNNSKLTMEMPETINTVPLNFSKDKKIKRTDKKETSYKHTYHINDDFAFETMIGSEMLKSDIISEVLKEGITNVLNAYDMKVFMYVISKREDNFLLDGKIVLPLVDIVKSVYPSVNSGYYEKCRISLHKLAYQRFSAITKNSRGLTIGILDSVFIGRKSEQGQEMVEVTVSEAIVSDLLKRRTIKLYKDSILNLKEPASQVLVFKLQAIRINHLAENSDTYSVLDISFFRSALFFSNKKRYENAKVVERALTDLMDNGIIIENFERKRYSFYVKFLPFTKEETRDLLEENKIDDEIALP